MALTGGMGSLPTDIPSRAIDFRGSEYTVKHHTDVDDGGDDSDGFGQSAKQSSDTDFPTSTETLYFHDRRMEREQTDVGERRVERIESSAYPDVQLKANDRTTHDGIDWVCETVELRPTPEDPSFVRATWKNLDT